MRGYLPSQASLLHPSPSSLTNSLCQALPQAAPCNYSPMPQTGEMGVCYTLCAELRKTTTVGPLFVNQTQGQNKMLSGTSWVLVIIIENCQAKEHFYWFPYLFIYFYHPGIFPYLCSALLLSLSYNHRAFLWTVQCNSVAKTLQAVHAESRTINKLFVSLLLNVTGCVTVKTWKQMFKILILFSGHQQVQLINTSSQISQSQIRKYIYPFQWFFLYSWDMSIDKMN